MGFQRPWPHEEQIPAIRAAVSLSVLANSEIWTVEDAQRCHADALAMGTTAVLPTMGWFDLLPHLDDFRRWGAATGSHASGQGGARIS